MNNLETFFNFHQLTLIMPEVFLLGSIVFILMLDLFLSEKNKQITYVLSQFALLGTIIITGFLVGTEKEVILSGHYIFDNLANTLKIIVLVFAMMYLVYSRYYLKVHQFFTGEYFVLSLLGILGTMVIMSGYSLLSIYLGVEILALSLYSLIAMAKHRKNSVEAALKYFVLSAIASGILLYGMSMLYGISGSLTISDIAYMSNQALESREILVLNFGLIFVIIGIAFKLGAVPFHMWVPDVYHGAPTPITMFISTIPKISVFVIMIRLLVEALGGLVNYWQDLLFILAVLSISIGTLIAIAQTNLKRLFAYSTISHIGFVLLGFSVGVIDGYISALFYILAYTLVGLAGFGVMIFLNTKGFEAQDIKDYQGLAKTNPMLAFMMLIVILSMAGIPPLIGFYSKFFVLQQVLVAGHIELAIFAVIFAVIGAFYYLKIIKAMYFKDSENTLTITGGGDIQLLLLINTLMILVFSLFPNYWLELAKSLLLVL
jgi:NADH-quinone oxidoreductase subunit N